MLPKLFEPFSRGPQSTRDAVPSGASRRGTGVGLALCRAIARVHGGELTLRQRSGGGASFEVSLPVEALPEVPGDTSAPEVDR